MQRSRARDKIIIAVVLETVDSENKSKRENGTVIGSDLSFLNFGQNLCVKFSDHA